MSCLEIDTGIPCSHISRKLCIKASATWEQVATKSRWRLKSLAPTFLFIYKLYDLLFIITKNCKLWLQNEVEQGNYIILQNQLFPRFVGSETGLNLQCYLVMAWEEKEK